MNESLNGGTMIRVFILGGDSQDYSSSSAAFHHP